MDSEPRWVLLIRCLMRKLGTSSDRDILSAHQLAANAEFFDEC